MTRDERINAVNKKMDEMAVFKKQLLYKMIEARRMNISKSDMISLVEASEIIVAGE